MTHPTRAERLETIGSAAAGLAHDLNNQLTLIVNHLDAQDLEGARAAAVQCSGLVEVLLAYGRGTTPHARAMEPGPFLRDYFAGLRLPPGVLLSLCVVPYLAPIWADPVGLTRALNNLISNSCQAMNGIGILRIRATPLAIEVRDSGPGIPPDLAGRIFQPFFTTRGDKGTGLGLAIARDTMRQCGGSVTLDPTCKVGACFTLSFRKP